MNFKSKKALALLMSSAMAATLIFANTVKAKDGTLTDKTLTARWYLGNGESIEAPRVVKVSDFHGESSFILVERVWSSNNNTGNSPITEFPIKYFFNEYGEASSFKQNGNVNLKPLNPEFEVEHRDYGIVVKKKEGKIEGDSLKLDFDVTEADIINLADYNYYEKHLKANNELIKKNKRADVKLAEPIQKEEKNELLKKEFIKQFGVVQFHDITYKEPGSDKEKYWLMYMDEQGAKVADAIMQNSNDAIYEPINLLDLKGNNANRFKLCLYDDSAHKYITVKQGNNENKLNLLDEGAFDNVENGNYKLIIDIDYGDTDISLTKGKTDITIDQKFHNNVVLDATFDFHFKKEPVVTESTLTLTDSTPKLIHVTFNDEYNNPKQILIKAGDKLLPSQVPTPVKEGYEFLGWYYKASDEYKLGPRGLEDELLPFNFNRSIYADFDLYAKWKKVEVEEKRPVPNTADC